MSCGAGQITRSVRVAEGRGGRNEMKSDEPLGKVPPSFMVYDYRPQDWGQSARAQGLINKTCLLTPSTSSPPLPSREEG